MLHHVPFPLHRQHYSALVDCKEGKSPVLLIHRGVSVHRRHPLAQQGEQACHQYGYGLDTKPDLGMCCRCTSYDSVHQAQVYNNPLYKRKQMRICCRRPEWLCLEDILCSSFDLVGRRKSLLHIGCMKSFPFPAETHLANKADNESFPFHL